MAWSYSSLKAFETCPYRFARVRIFRDVADPPSEAGAFGIAVHAELAAAIEHGPEKLGEHTQAFRRTIEFFRSLRDRLDVDVERKVALDAGGKQVDWFSPECHLRAIYDVIARAPSRALIADFKTSKRVSPDETQLVISAWAARRVWPTLERFTLSYIWLRHDTVTTTHYSFEELDVLMQPIAARAARMSASIAMEDYPKIRSGLCRKHCPVTDCEYYGR